MKLFRVTIEQEIVVLAESAQDAEMDAPGYADDDGEPVIMASEITRFEMLDGGWLESRPFGCEGTEFDDMTCTQIFALLAERTAEAKRIAEFEARQVLLPLVKP